MSKTLNLLVKGQPSFSLSHNERLKDFLSQSLKLDYLEIEINDFYLIQSDNPNTDFEGILEVLRANRSFNDPSFFIGPRPGTITPWSSKTSEIMSNVGFGKIQIEKFNGFLINQRIDQDLNLDRIHDQMTQKVYFEAPTDFFTNIREQKDSLSIDFLENDIQSIEEANLSLGLALSNEEIAYLAEFYRLERRDPTDAELMMFAQANSEHCRHKIFNAKWVINGKQHKDSLFDLIKKTSTSKRDDLISAYKDNAAVIEGEEVSVIRPNHLNSYAFEAEKINTLIKVETHNHPTAISPYPGAATGSGGEIRDEGATGIGAKPKTGIVGFNVSNLRINKDLAWEGTSHSPSRIASPLQIMIEAPIGAAAFNNEFGRPCTIGYFRVLETAFESAKAFGYHKPIMLAGGIGQIRDRDSLKQNISTNYLIIVLGGPSMLIGLGGGAASSMSSGESDEFLDYASVQRDNAEMQRRCQEVINTCTNANQNIIEFIHDVGAGGLSNAIPELAKDTGLGIRVQLDAIPTADKSMTPMEIWCNESQERYVLAIHQDQRSAFEKICKRERCPFSIVGETIEEKKIIVEDPHLTCNPVDVPLDMLFGDLPITEINVDIQKNILIEDETLTSDIINDINLILKHPSVGSKMFLITIGDRTVGGLIARDQLIGKYQVPTSNFSMTSRSFIDTTGEVIALGEKPTLAIVDPAASMRMALGEALLNLIGAPIQGLDRVALSANWMAAADYDNQNIALREGVESLSKICCDLGIAIPVGKDSLSMKTTWKEKTQIYEVISPLSGIITAVAPVTDTRKAITTELNPTSDYDLYAIRLSKKMRMAGSIYSIVKQASFNETPDIDDPKKFKLLFDAIQKFIVNGDISTIHDISDGGLFVTLCELAFTNKLGLKIELESSKDDIYKELFNEELGLVIQIAKNKESVLAEVEALGCLIRKCAELDQNRVLEILDTNGDCAFKSSIADLEKTWLYTSTEIRKLRDNPDAAVSEQAIISNPEEYGLTAEENFKYSQAVPTFINTTKPKVAILREQGINGQSEMAAAFTLAGFEALDVHMQDILDGCENLKNYTGIAACGGFSYGDVLGAGGGWASTIKYNSLVRDIFQTHFNDSNKFTFGVCNGCQMISLLKDLIVGAESWPNFTHNLSDQFEARLSQVKVLQSDSVLLEGMSGWLLPVAVAHGEGRAILDESSYQSLLDKQQIAMNFTNAKGDSTEKYPLNPNGSSFGVTALTAAEGRVTIMMPHPERVFRTSQFSWRPKHWKEFSPWMQIFINARKFLE